MNNTSAAVSESVQVGGSTLSVSLPAGPYVRVTGTGVTLRVAGQRLSGDFSFERVAVTGGNLVRITVSNVSLSFGDGSRNFLVLTEGEGVLIIQPSGVAGRLSAHVELQNVPGVTLAGTLSLELNTSAVAVSQTIAGGAFPVQLDLPAGPYLKVERHGRHAPRRRRRLAQRQLHLRAQASRERHLDDDDGGSDRVRHDSGRRGVRGLPVDRRATRSRSTTSSCS